MLAISADRWSLFDCLQVTKEEEGERVEEVSTAGLLTTHLGFLLTLLVFLVIVLVLNQQFFKKSYALEIIHVADERLTDHHCCSTAARTFCIRSILYPYYPFYPYIISILSIW